MERHTQLSMLLVLDAGENRANKDKRGIKGS